MLEYKQGLDARVPVRLLDSSGNPITGVVFSGVTATVAKADGTTADVTPADSNHWIELSFGAYSGKGNYWLIIPAANINVTGILMYAVKTTAGYFTTYVKVVANEEIDTYTISLKALGLLHENTVLDQTSFDAYNNLVFARLRTYDTKANAQLAGLSGLQHTYSITATYVGQNMQTYTVVLES